MEALISSNILAIIVSVMAFSISGIFMLALIPREQKSPGGDQKWNELSMTLVHQETQTDLTSVSASPMQLRDMPHSIVKAVLLPIEKSGQKFHISVGDIVSVHANAHYTFVFNGSDDLFCPLSISEVDERLGSSPFFRTHRSYIVNLNHIVRVKKAGDAAVVELDSSIRRTVPVSRMRVAQLREEWTAFKSNLGNQ